MIFSPPPLKKKTPQPGLCNLKTGVPHPALHPPKSFREQLESGGGPQDPPSCTPSLQCTGRTSLWGCPHARGSVFWGGKLPPAFRWHPQLPAKGISCSSRSRSCIPASGEAGGVSRWRRNLLFAPVLLQEVGGRKKGRRWGGSWQLLLFNFIFLPPSRNLCNVPAAPREAGVAVSHCCRWNVTQSCCSPGRT